MTAIAYRNGVMAADRQVTEADHKSICNKILIIETLAHGKMMFSMSGNIVARQQIVDHLRDHDKGSKEAFPDLKVESRYGIAVDQHENIYGVYGNGALILQHSANDYIAEGSAFLFMMGAMAMGASAHRAVELATEHMEYCGHGVDTMSFNEVFSKELPEIPF